ncbi:hypothetical protein V3851_18145 [Paenibacillus sp. M1]|uniref:Uncharacterized protein n=1 Tax=Paenibacillus haidiansis TaxID=1574488 RepID=A0ABU7VWZ8_9BACL
MNKTAKTEFALGIMSKYGMARWRRQFHRLVLRQNPVPFQEPQEAAEPPESKEVRITNHIHHYNDIRQITKETVRLADAKGEGSRIIERILTPVVTVMLPPKGSDSQGQRVDNKISRFISMQLPAAKALRELEAGGGKRKAAGRFLPKGSNSEDAGGLTNREMKQEPERLRGRQQPFTHRMQGILPVEGGATEDIGSADPLAGRGDRGGLSQQPSAINKQIRALQSLEAYRQQAGKAPVHGRAQPLTVKRESGGRQGLGVPGAGHAAPASASAGNGGGKPFMKPSAATDGSVNGTVTAAANPPAGPSGLGPSGLKLVLGRGTQRALERLDERYRPPGPAASATARAALGPRDLPWSRAVHGPAGLALAALPQGAAAPPFPLARQGEGGQPLPPAVPLMRGPARRALAPAALGAPWPVVTGEPAEEPPARLANASPLSHLRQGGGAARMTEPGEEGVGVLSDRPAPKLVLRHPEKRAAAAESKPQEASAPEWAAAAQGQNHTATAPGQSAKAKLDIGAEEVKLLAEQVYQVLEKRIGIQKDRRGLR